MYLSFVLGFIILLIFILMFVSRHRSRGTIAFHRHPDDLRRRRSERVEEPEISQGWQI